MKVDSSRLSSMFEGISVAADAGLTPAVNMDTGFGNLLTPEQKVAVLDATRSALGGKSFVAGAFVADVPGKRLDTDGYRQAVAAVVERGMRLELDTSDTRVDNMTTMLRVAAACGADTLRT